ncbi:type 1 glutamine amidotransferase [Nocardioides sp. GY 10113]|uniref:type 1 glutamine amidotransferase n=1 Tax=Nocardioides sp. GY 10113 TaxID=2569761 RepID=UPI0010A840EA|nr:type 1 glutamine amidotransferase [Nocardioides sp. GY 10113]TIC87388.1 type 1 glutamine amidotransferase [Nocardioides sp. GY 10113]
MRVLFIAHDHMSPEGPIGERFAQRGYEVVVHRVVPRERYDSPGVDADFPDFTEFDAVVALGAPWSSYDAGVASWVDPEMAQLRRADEAGVPVLGICFGGQLLAQTHGGSVGRSDHPEIGWVEVESDEPAIVPPGPWFQWHYDRWTLPAGAREVARNAAASQAFVLRRNLALQFHPELVSTTLAGWLGNGGAAEARTFGHDLDELFAGTAAVDQRSRERAHALVDGFLDLVAPGDAAGVTAAAGRL